MRLEEILDKSLEGQRLGEAEALHLFEAADLADLAVLASATRQRLNPGHRVSYVVDRNVNYTDVCNVYCTFCAFYHKPGDARGYVLTKEQLRQKAEESKSVGGTGFLLQAIDAEGPQATLRELVAPVLVARASTGPAR